MSYYEEDGELMCRVCGKHETQCTCDTEDRTPSMLWTCGVCGKEAAECTCDPTDDDIPFNNNEYVEYCRQRGIKTRIKGEVYTEGEL